ENSDKIDINFLLNGGMRADFESLGEVYDIRKGSHNMKFTPDSRNTHFIDKDQSLQMFHLSLDHQFFIELIGCEDAWSEQFIRRIESKENFMAADHFPDITPTMLNLIQGIQSRIDEGNCNRLKLHSMVFDLLALQVDQIKSLNTPAKKNDLVSAADTEKLYHAKRYVERHFLEDLTLDSICRQSLLNEFKLKKGFKLLFNTSVIHYVRQLRMEYARCLLRDNHQAVDEVASVLGYQYAQHFSVAFKKHFGISPSQV
ncbi:MAG TPA: AraC family transcriptional regulator, partial [Cyclobacteriaceae bacterium]